MSIRSTRFLALCTAAGLALSACGGITRDDAIETLTADGGFTEDTANCIMDDLEAEGYEPGDLEDGNLEGDQALQDQLGVSVQTCMTGADVAGVMGEGSVRTILIDSLVSSGSVDAEQAECVVAAIEADGMDLDSVVEDPDALTAALVEKLPTCQ